ncbi:MAG TPA: radical SAM protein [Terriglobia bacterium]|nr:radical SAM protein [Terriglobia bacterium]
MNTTRTKRRNRLQIAASYFRHKTVLSGGPIEITLESTAKCNLYCPMCPRHIYTFDNENMDLALYKKIVEDCKDYVEFVWPYGIGEPMIHPNIFEMIRITRDAGIRTGMSTNATLLDERRRDMLLDSGLDYVILAFDGASKETYEKYRFGATFEKTRENILNFLQRKLDRKSPIYVVLQMVMLKENSHEVEAYKKLWSIPGVDEIRFKRDEVQIDGSKIPDGEQKGQRRNPCHLLWRGPLYVRYDGLAYPCCYMYDEKPVGDLKKQSVMEVWNSPAMVQLRGAHLTGDLSPYPICQTCQAPRPSLAAMYGSLMLNSLTVRKAVPAMEKLARFYRVGVFEKS